MSIEQKVKSDYVSIFKKSDWELFKLGADKYFESAAELKRKDIASEEIILPNLKKKDARLLLRNKRKRLFIGLGCELLIKAFYLKSGFYINSINNKKGLGSNAFKFSELTDADIDTEKTLKFDLMIAGLGELDRKVNERKKGKVDSQLKDALCIAKVFRNKEAHIITKGHKYDRKDYNEIENGIKKMYEIWFSEKLEFKISFEPNQDGIFEIN